MCGPFCSVPAVPMMTVVVPAATRSRTSAQVRSSRKTLSGGLPEGPVLGASAGRWADSVTRDSTKSEASKESVFIGNSRAYSTRGGLAHRRCLSSLALLVGLGALVSGHAWQIDSQLQAHLRALFPAAASFSPKEGEPPHFKAYDQRQTITGYAFWTTELEPLERAYDGPIKILVGMNPNGILAGIVVVQHNEPYGNFSIEVPQFPAQFRGKNIRDPFRVADIHAVSRATITVTSASRAVRNSARRLARQLLTPPGQ